MNASALIKKLKVYPRLRTRLHCFYFFKYSKLRGCGEKLPGKKEPYRSKNPTTSLGRRKENNFHQLFEAGVYEKFRSNRRIHRIIFERRKSYLNGEELIDAADLSMKNFCIGLEI